MVLVWALGLLANQVWQPRPGHTQIQIWPGAAPDLQPTAAERCRLVTGPLVAGRPWVEVENVSQPTMTVFKARGKNTGVAMVVFPGGGYGILAIDLEGTEICEWLANHGITGVLLKYRVPYSGPHYDPKVGHEVVPPALTAVEDAQRTIGLVRLNARQWGIDPHRVGVVGFSAGGHLVAASSNAPTHLYKAIDAADRLSCRPDFAIALYPGHLWHEATGLTLNPTIKVTNQTPPTLIVQAEDDPVDNVNNSIVYDLALKKAGVPVDMHLFAHGGHAFGLRPTKQPITRWPQLMLKWLRNQGIVGS
jgi:acetyl esterase/lipase